MLCLSRNPHQLGSCPSPAIHQAVTPIMDHRGKASMHILRDIQYEDGTGNNRRGKTPSSPGIGGKGLVSRAKKNVSTAVGGSRCLNPSNRFLEGKKTSPAAAASIRLAARTGSETSRSSTPVTDASSSRDSHPPSSISSRATSMVPQDSDCGLPKDDEDSSSGGGSSGEEEYVAR